MKETFVSWIYTADVIFVMTPQGPKIARDYCDKKVRFLMAHTKWTKEIPRIGVHFTEALEFEISFPHENLVWMELFSNYNLGRWEQNIIIGTKLQILSLAVAAIFAMRANALLS